MKRVLTSLFTLLFMLGMASLGHAAEWSISPWTDDVSSGIASEKTYTHAINNNGTDDGVVTVNGVDFDNVYNSGSVEEGWTLAGGNWADDTSVNMGGDSAGLALNTRFHYGLSELVLYGLTPGARYELTLFSVAWEDGSRQVTLTDSEGTFEFNQDEYGNNNGIKIVGLYNADENGELHLGLVNDFHIYAFANCEYAPAIKQISPEKYITGIRVSQTSELVWDEVFPGLLTSPVFDVYMDPNETKVTELDPATRISSKQSSYSFAPEMDYETIYFWRVACYVNAEDTEPTLFTAVNSFMTEYETEHWSDFVWTNDADSGISAGKNYTHKVNFNANEAFKTVVNAVAFDNDSDRTGDNWTLAGAGSGAGGGHHVAGDGGTLVSTMYYGADAVMTLTGLTPGEEYVFTEYTRGWGNPGGRFLQFHTNIDDRITLLDGNIDGDGNGHIFEFGYTAPASGQLVITFTPINSNDTWHHYAFSNEIATPGYVDPMPLPNGNIDADSELSWTLHGDVASPTYTVTVATDPNMLNVVDSTTTTATTFSPDIDSDMNYYWQIAINDGGSVVYTSPIWSFATTPPPLADLVIEWKFDETSGTIAEQTAPTEDADGTLIGFNDPDASQNVAGIDGAGLRLNGLDEYVDVSDAYVYMPTSDEQPFAISGYFRTFKEYGPLFSMRKEGNETPIIDICLGHDGVTTALGMVCLLVRDDTGSYSSTYAPIPVNDGAWHNFIVSRTEGRWTLYIDGVSSAVMTGVASGTLTLDWLGIGNSIEWSTNGWNPDLPYYRDVEGVIDEYTVWQGTLQPSQIAELAAKVPAKTDIDEDMDTDLDDLNTVAVNWLSDTAVEVQDDVNLEDFENYVFNDPNAVDGYWVLPPERIGEEYGTSTFSVVDDPNLDEGKVLQWDYTFNEMPYVHSRYVLNERRLDINLYDTIQFVVKKLPEANAGTFIVDIFDGRDNVDPLADGLYYRGRLDLDVSTIPVNNWVVIERTIPTDFTRSSAQYCHDLFQFDFYISNDANSTSTTGPIQIAQINLIDSTTDCVLTAGQTGADINADCIVNLVDFEILAEAWMNAQE